MFDLNRPDLCDARFEHRDFARLAFLYKPQKYGPGTTSKQYLLKYRDGEKPYSAAVVPALQEALESVEKKLHKTLVGVRALKEDFLG